MDKQRVSELCHRAKAGGLEILARYQRQVKLSEPRKELSDALLDWLKRQANAGRK